MAATESVANAGCSAHSDCPARYKCYRGSDSSGVRICMCNKAMLFQGPGCTESNIISLVTFFLTLYVMTRCAKHSYRISVVHFKKWWVERSSHQYRGVVVSCLPFIGSCWVFSASSSLVFCCFLNLARSFSLVPEKFVSRKLLPGAFGLGTLQWTLAVNFISLFWGEVALKQRHIRQRSPRQTGTVENYFKCLRYSCLLLSVGCMAVFFLLNVANTYINILEGLGICSYVLLLFSPLILTGFVCAVGTCLIWWELKELPESIVLPSVRKVLVDIRTAAAKVLFYMLLYMLIMMAYTVCEARPNGTVPDIVIHLLLIMLYLSISVILVTMGKYLAALKVTMMPEWCIFVMAGCGAWLCCLGSCRRRRRNEVVVPVEERRADIWCSSRSPTTTAGNQKVILSKRPHLASPWRSSQRPFDPPTPSGGREHSSVIYNNNNNNKTHSQMTLEPGSKASLVVLVSGLAVGEA
mmetsp:Transcript_29108/g.50300  ORF Transcript_29108/g.50300 Transcript_29108/m.50300 type:complete len:466 (-) Transcript_29108:76-1473(-)